MKSKKILLIVLGILLSLSLLVGISYAYYMVTASQTNKNRLASSCISISLTNEKNDITLNNAYPITNSEGKKLTPYQFTITNTCNIFISYNVNLEMLEGTDLSTDYIKTMVNSEAPYILSSLDSASTTINKSTESRTLAQGSLGSGDSVDYALRLWMDENTPLNENTQNKSLISKIVVVAQPSTYKPSDYVTTLHDAILVNEYGVTSVDNAISKIEAKGTPDLSQTAPIIKWQETENGTTNMEVIKLSELAINSDEYTSDMPLTDSLLAISSNISFDSTSGMYTLSNNNFYDPTTLDYKNNDYYIYYEAVAIDRHSNKLYNYALFSNDTVYKIVSATKENVTKNIQGIKEYSCIKYTLNVIKLSAKEVENDKSDKGIYSAKDDYGKSYYYRGNVLNNNVYFAGYNWKAIRINGDNSIRLIYSGKNNENDYISNGTYNDTNIGSVNSGYMYGKNTDTIENINKNEISSSIKDKLDAWYVKNIKDKKFEGYISDSGFCNDRSTIYASSVTNLEWKTYNRYRTNAATLICENATRDLFTTNTSEIGNKALTYPVGLITYDELLLSGLASSKMNRLSYLNSSSHYWTMSPEIYNGSVTYTYNFVFSSKGLVEGSWVNDNSIAIRPVINLKADVEISGGIGTINDPYVIKTD